MNETLSSTVPKDVRKEFLPIAGKYRLHGWLVGAGICTAIFLGWAPSLFNLGPSPWLVGFSAICLLGSVALAFQAPKLRCPACSVDVAGKIETYCPDCGGSPLAARWLVWRRCLSCQKLLGPGKGRRNYRVRYCTKCGSYLHEEGL